MVALELTGSGMMGVTRDAMLALRRVLFRETGANAATYLHEAGYAGGKALHDAFVRWCRSKNLALPENMAAPQFEQHTTAFFSELGWGSLQVGMLRDAVMTFESANWAEADPASAMQYPGCYLTTGLFTDFLGRVGESPVTVMEVECRSMGAARCRFLVGSAETMQHLYDGMTQGKSYEDALAQMA
jgi:predicted hydrocarbon binding protein